MDITWIIGNGFDLNLGLKTKYVDFLNLWYRNEDLTGPFSAEKSRLLDSFQRACEDTPELWSDLELLSFAVTSCYEESELRTYSLGVEDLVAELIKYLTAEQEKANALCNAERAEVVRSSISNLCSCLTRRDSGLLSDVFSVKAPIRYNFISLNYTHAFDGLLDLAKSGDASFSRHVLGKVYTDKITEVLHVHGLIDDDGQYVFGVNDESQITNKAFADNRSFKELRLKRELNKFYGNMRCDEALNRIVRSQLIVVYGCSLGDTDGYLWEAVVSRLRKDSKVHVVLFDFDIPKTGSMELYDTQQKRDNLRRRLLGFGDFGGPEYEEIEERVIVENSGAVFNFDGLSA